MSGGTSCAAKRQELGSGVVCWARGSVLSAKSSEISAVLKSEVEVSVNRYEWMSDFSVQKARQWSAVLVTDKRAMDDLQAISGTRTRGSGLKVTMRLAPFTFRVAA